MKLNVFLIIFFQDDHSRVILQNSDNDYINASLVVNEEAQRTYILTQVIIRLLSNTKFDHIMLYSLF